MTPVGGPVTVEELVAAVGHLPVIVFAADAAGRITFCGGGALALLGLAGGEMVGSLLRDLVADGGAPTGDLVGGGHDRRVTVAGTEWKLSCGTVRVGGAGLAGVLAPVDDRWCGTGPQARVQARYRALAEHSSDLVCVIDDRALVAYVSPSVEKLLGWSPRDVVGRPATDFVRTDVLGELGDVLEDLRAGLILPESRRGATRRVTTRLRHADGTWRDYELIASDYLDEPSIGGYVVNGRDVTDRRRADLRLRHASLHDSLTGLPNRGLLIQEVQSALLHGSDRPGRQVVVAIGIDRFKLVNDSLGHDLGDNLLVAVGRRLRREVRAADTVARLGGDTFAVATSGVADGVEARALASRLIAIVSQPYDLAGRRIAVSAGAGVAVSGPDDDGTTMVRNADTALYAAKRLGRGRVELFEPRLRADAARQLDLEQSLGRATANGELRVYFQPIMALAEDPCEQEVVGAEALVRWQHPGIGLVPPNDFIPMAEETGHIVEIGSWVLAEACRCLMSWAEGPGSGPLRLSVNLSPRQLLEPDLPDVVTDILVTTGFPAERLTMEVTESVLVDEGPFVATTLQRLREMGVRLSIDDFGTGYSSLVYLRRLNADALKIDRSFVDGLGRDSEAHAIVLAVISLARSLGLDLVAEGVETDDQRRLLVGLGCQFAQGYLFSRPVPGAELERWRARGPAAWSGPSPVALSPPASAGTPE